MPENSMLKKRHVYTPCPATTWKRSYFDLRTDVGDGFQPFVARQQDTTAGRENRTARTENFPETASPQ